MALTYHAGRRIQGISITPATGLALCDNFSTDKGWATSCSTYMGYVSGQLKTEWNGGGTNKTVVYDLGAGSVSDTKWVLRMKVNMGSTSGADNEGFIGISDSDETAGRCTAQDFLGVSFLAGYSTTAWNGFYEAEANGAILPPTSGNLLVYNFSDSTDYWLEIKRTSATSLTYTLYSDAFSTSLGTQTVTVASGVSGLRYIKFANYPGASTNQPGAYADDVQFYNDVTSPSAAVPATGDTKPTNVQTGSRFEETDTRKMYKAQDITGSDVSLTGLKAYYKFDESSGNLINQSTTGDGLGSNADGTASGDPTYSVTGKINKAISFDGDGDKFTLGTTAGQWNFLHNNTNFSVSFWLKLNATPSENQGILGTGTGGSSIGFDLTVNHSTGGKLRFSIENGAGASANIQSSAGFVPQNTTTWYHYVLTFSNGSWNIYRNDGNNESASSSVAWSTSNHSRDMELANANANTPTDVKDLTGELDEVSIWSRVLTSSEITALYNSGAGKLISTTTQWQEIGT